MCIPTRSGSNSQELCRSHADMVLPTNIPPPEFRSNRGHGDKCTSSLTIATGGDRKQKKPSGEEGAEQRGEGGGTPKITLSNSNSSTQPYPRDVWVQAMPTPSGSQGNQTSCN